MKTQSIIVLVIAIGLMLYAAKFSINFNPFKISLKAPYELFGMLFLIGALICFSIGNYNKGFNDGVDKCIEQVENQIDHANTN